MVTEYGDIYEGKWVDDRAEGLGQMHYCDGSSYIGDWSEDK